MVGYRLTVYGIIHVYINYRTRQYVCMLWCVFLCVDKSFMIGTLSLLAQQTKMSPPVAEEPKLASPKLTKGKAKTLQKQLGPKSKTTLKNKLATQSKGAKKGPGKKFLSD